MPSPLEQDMGRIYNADNDGGYYSSTQTEPESCTDNRYIIKPLKYIMEHRLIERSQIMEEADPDDR
jgi:hypothetical protein